MKIFLYQKRQIAHSLGGASFPSQIYYTVTWNMFGVTAKELSVIYTRNKSSDNSHLFTGTVSVTSELH